MVALKADIDADAKCNDGSEEQGESGFEPSRLSLDSNDAVIVMSTTVSTIVSCEI